MKPQAGEDLQKVVDGHLRKGKGLHACGEAGRSLRAVEDVLRGEAGGSLQAVEDVLRGEAGRSLQAVEDVLLGEGRQAATEDGAVLPVEWVGAAAAVDCSCCRTCDVIKTSPPNKG